jgi:hypothetical protein
MSARTISPVGVANRKRRATLGSSQASNARSGEAATCRVTFS